MSLNNDIYDGTIYDRGRRHAPATVAAVDVVVIVVHIHKVKKIFMEVVCDFYPLNLNLLHL